MAEITQKPDKIGPMHDRDREIRDPDRAVESKMGIDMRRVGPGEIPYMGPDGKFYCKSSEPKSSLLNRFLNSFIMRLFFPGLFKKKEDAEV